MTSLTLILESFPGAEVLTSEEARELKAGLADWDAWQEWRDNKRLDPPPLSLEDIPTMKRRISVGGSR